MVKINVELEKRTYPIWIGEGTFERLPEFVGENFSCHSALIVTDSNVRSLYADKIVIELAKSISNLHIFDFSAGEESKNIHTLDLLLRFAAKSGLDRKSCIFALGGGVVGDIAGFAAAVYMRGIPYFQIPTTLLAMVDSSVGGKTAIDLPEGKNLVGAFWQPKGVLIDTDSLKSLPEREIKCGLAEIIKYGVIMDSKFFDFIEEKINSIKNLDKEVMTKLIARSCELKAEVVAGDEREESGLRAILNYGHTFGHAIETVTGYGEYHHGEAVAIGMCLAAKFALTKKIITEEKVHRIIQLIQNLGLPISFKKFSAEKIISAMKKDKKNLSGIIRLVLPEDIGKVSLVNATEDELLKFLNIETQSS